MGFRFQSYLHKNRHGTLCFRWRPPRDVADRFTQSAFVYSLGTKECKRACARALNSLTRVNQFVALLRTMKSDKSKLFNTEIVRSIVLPDGTEHKMDYDPRNPAELAEADRVLGPPVSDERAADEGFERLEQALKPPPPARGRVSTPLISVAFQTFCAQKRSEGAWKDPEHGERYDYGPIVTELIQASGDRPIGSLAVEHVRAFKAKILADASSSATKAKKLGRIKSFLNWARDEQQLTSVSTAILQLSGRKIDSAHYEAFSDDDLKKLFNSPAYRDQSFAKASEFWLPLLGLYTGARINELAQLHLDDISEHDDVPVLSINDEGDKRTKTPASSRKVPIHPRLIEAGFLEYHQLVRAQGWQRLFPELTRSNIPKNGYGKEPGKFFTKYRRAQGVSLDADRKKVFHSFRTTANSMLRFAEVPQERRERLIGHESEGTNNKVYRPDDLDRMFPIARLLADLEKLDFGLQHPKYEPCPGHRKERLSAARRRSRTKSAEPGDQAALLQGK